MAVISRIIGVLLLVAVVSALPGASALTATPPTHEAGCHDHSRVPASPEPVRYQCCVIGHHAAVPTAAFILDVLATINRDRADGVFLISWPLTDSAIQVDPFHGPPRISALRV